MPYQTYIVHASTFMLPMGEGAGVSKTAGLGLHEVAAKSRLVLDVAHLVFVVCFEVEVFAITTGLVRVWFVVLVMIF